MIAEEEESAEKQRIKEEQEKEEAVESDRQQRLAANEEAKVSNLVVNSLYIQLTSKQSNSLCVTLLLDRRRV